jgi:hypothetical protein
MSITSNANTHPVSNSDTMPESPATATKSRFKLPPEFSIFLVLFGISVFFEALGWYLNGQSFIFNQERLKIIILQMSVIGIIAVGSILSSSLEVLTYRLALLSLRQLLFLQVLPKYQIFRVLFFRN